MWRKGFINFLRLPKYGAVPLHTKQPIGIQTGKEPLHASRDKITSASNLMEHATVSMKGRLTRCGSSEHTASCQRFHQGARVNRGETITQRNANLKSRQSARVHLDCWINGFPHTDTPVTLFSLLCLYLHTYSRHGRSRYGCVSCTRSEGKIREIRYKQAGIRMLENLPLSSCSSSSLSYEYTRAAFDAYRSPCAVNLGSDPPCES